MPTPHMKELDDTECHKRLAERHLGRLAIPDFAGPVIFPVNYVFDQNLVIFRTDPGSKLEGRHHRLALPDTDGVTGSSPVAPTTLGLTSGNVSYPRYLTGSRFHERMGQTRPTV